MRSRRSGIFIDKFGLVNVSWAESLMKSEFHENNGEAFH